jgi:hypothetical protein
VTYGPKGDRLKIIAEKVAPFEAVMNEVLAAFGSYQVTICTDPWGIFVDGHDFKGRTLTNRPAELLCTSERLILSTALQVALATITGINIVIVDNAEILMSKFKAALMQVARAGMVGQCILITSAPDNFKPPTMEGVEFIHVGAEG